MPDFLNTAKLSFSTAVYDAISHYIVTKDDDHLVTKAAKITGSFIVTPVFVVASIVESVVRALLSIPAKLIHLFIPKSLSEGFEEHVLDPLAAGSAMSADTAGTALLNPILNFFPEGSAREQIRDFPEDLTNRVFDFFNPALEYQFFN